MRVTPDPFHSWCWGGGGLEGHIWTVAFTDLN